MHRCAQAILLNKDQILAVASRIMLHSAAAGRYLGTYMFCSNRPLKSELIVLDSRSSSNASRTVTPDTTTQC